MRGQADVAKTNHDVFAEDVVQRTFSINGVFFNSVKSSRVILEVLD